MSITGSLPRKWSIRRICSSSSTSRSSAFSAAADSRSWPNGFSTTTRALVGQAGLAEAPDHLANSDGGISR